MSHTNRPSRNQATPSEVGRRSFLSSATVGAALGVTLGTAKQVNAASDKPALLGGTPISRGTWPQWPVTDSTEEAAIQEVLRSGNWYRYQAGNSGAVARFEQQWSETIGVSHCLATANGTSSLVVALASLGIGPGDEVLVPPYTFVATINAVLSLHALPVFVDSDGDTGLIDPAKIDQNVTSETRAIIPVHVAGAPCDMDRIAAAAKRRGLYVVEDACQAHTGEWRGQRVGGLGDFGCFSFQNSKNITSGEGGAVTTQQQRLFARAQAFHNNGSGRSENDGGYTTNGANYRLTEFQAAILIEQQHRLDAQSEVREKNGAYLAKRLEEVPGMRAKRLYPGTTRHGYHLFMADYDAAQFAGMSKQRFLEAIQAEGIPLSGGYQPLNKKAFLNQVLNSRGFQRIYGRERLNRYHERNECPVNDQMCQNTVWLGQSTLLANRSAMNAIVEAFARVQHHASSLV